MEPVKRYKTISEWSYYENDILGKGTFGEVFKGWFDKDPSKLVAIKQISRGKIDEKIMKCIEREYSIQIDINSNFIVKMFGARNTKNNIYFILEYCKEGDLQKFLEVNGKISGKDNFKVLDESQVKLFMRHIMEGFRVLSEHNIIHRDIKPANILINDGFAKISDFGFSRFIEKEKAELYSIVGTPLYFAPEVFLGKQYDSKCDVFSFGCLVFYLLQGTPPIPAMNDRQYKNKMELNATIDFNSLTCSKELKRLLFRMLEKNMEKRLNWKDVFEDIYFQKNEENLKNNFQKTLELAESQIEINNKRGFNQILSTKPLTPRTQHPNKFQNETDIAYFLQKQNQFEKKALYISQIIASKKNCILYLKEVMGIVGHIFQNQININLYPNETDCMLMIILIKNCSIMLQELKSSLDKSEPPSSKITDEEWNYYKNSMEKKNRLAEIDNSIEECNQILTSILFTVEDSKIPGMDVWRKYSYDNISKEDNSNIYDNVLLSFLKNFKNAKMDILFHQDNIKLLAYLWGCRSLDIFQAMYSSDKEDFELFYQSLKENRRSYQEKMFELIMSIE